MGSSKYPPLKRREIIRKIKALGFHYVRTTGSHEVYEKPAQGNDPRRVVPIDDYPEFEKKMIKTILREIHVDRDKFYDI